MGETNPLSVLIVDDEPAIHRTLSGLLKLHGYRCEGEADPLTALDRLAEDSFQIVLVDIVMPGMDGLDFVRRLRDAGSLAEVVIMTAYSSLDRAVRAHRLGVSGYLLKPFDSLEQVLVVVRSAEARFRHWAEALRRTVDPWEVA